jgi:hypothetical protein
MIGKKALKENDCVTIEDYYKLIVESKVNGQIAQVKSMIENLSSDQRTDLLKYVWSNESVNGEVAQYIAEKL